MNNENTKKHPYKVRLTLTASDDHGMSRSETITIELTGPNVFKDLNFRNAINTLAFDMATQLGFEFKD